MENQENNIYDEKYTGTLAPLWEYLKEKDVKISNLSAYNTEDLIYFLIDSDHITPQFGIVLAEISGNTSLLSTLLDRYKIQDGTMRNMCETCSVPNLSIILGYYFRQQNTRNCYLFFNEICNSGSIDKLSLVLSYDSNNLEDKLYDAVSSGKLNMVRYLIDFGAVCDKESFTIACELDYINILQYFISIGAIYPDSGIEQAIINGNLEIIKLLYLHRTHLMFVINNDTLLQQVNRYMYSAAMQGHINIALWFMCNGANAYNICMVLFAQHGTFDDVNALIAMGAENLGEALQGACISNKLDTVIQLLKIGADGDDMETLRESFGWVCYADNVEILQYLIDEGYASHDFLDYGMSDACIRASYNCIQLLLNMGVQLEESYILRNLLYYTTQQFITLSELATNEIDINTCLTMLCENNYCVARTPLYDYLIKKGARCNGCFGSDLSCSGILQFI